MRRRVHLAVLGTVLVLAPTAAAQPGAAAPPAARPGVTEPGAAGGDRHGVDRGGALQDLLDAEHAAGMPGVFAEVRDGDRTWRGASGVADVATGEPARPWFSHRVGSITKTFVSTTVLQLVAEHRIALDAPVARYLPGLLPADLGRQVTVRMLLNHTSGLGNYTDTVDGLEAIEGIRNTTFTPRELVAMGLSLPPTNPPGQGWSYSNTNYIIAGLLVERVTGRSLESEVGRRILKPLGLTRTYFPGTDPTIRGPHAKAYVPWSDGSLRDFSEFNMSWAWSAGALISTPQDLNRFYRALLSGKLLKPAQLAEMRTTVVVDPATPEVGGYGLGLYWVRLSCGPVWGHDGGVIGQVTISWHSPDGTRQASLGENLSFHDIPAIDEARMRFLDAALCGTQPSGASGAPSAGRPAAPSARAVPSVDPRLLTPDVSPRPAR